MIQMKKAFFAVALLVSMSANAHYGRSFFLGANVGNIAGGGLHEQAGRTHLFDNDKIYGSFNAHMEYNSSFNASRLGEYLSPIANKSFVVGDLNTGANAATNVYAPYFLIEETFDATIAFKPKSSTFTSNLNLFVGLDEWVEGLWLDFNLPIVHNKRHVKINETITTAAGAQFVGELFANGTAGAQPVPVYTTFTSAMVGDKGLTVGAVVGNMNFGQINGSRSTTKVGNFTAVLGYDVMNKENMHLGVGLLGLVNGNGKSDARYMFEPSVGTGGRHGLGGRVNGHVRMYEKDDMEFNLYLNADVVHLFDATVKRTYDLTTKHGVWSRYILFKEFATLGGAAATSGIVHGVNFTTLQAKVGMDVMYNVDLVLGYTNGSLGVNVGYGLFGHSKEEHKSWVDAFTTKNYGALAQGVTDMDTGAPRDTLVSSNVKIDGGNGSGAAATSAGTNALTNIIVLADLDKNSAMNPSAMVHRVHGDVNYRWEDNEWAPHVGGGAGAEFGSNNAALRQWGVHAHFGICF